MSPIRGITGSTAILFILCDPVHHVRGSDLLNRRFAGDGIDAAVSPLHVVPGDLPRVVDAIRTMRNVAGFGVTIPHKIDVMPLLDELTPQAERLGSVNIVRRDTDGSLTGGNVDGEGFLHGLGSRGIPVAGRRVLQLGAGGAGRAVGFAIALAGAGSLAVWNRNRQRAVSLAADIAQTTPECEVRVATDPAPEGFDLVVNTTPAGMDGYAGNVLDVSRLSKENDIAEIVIQPEETPLVAAARAQGLRVSVGADMLHGQYEPMRDFLGLNE